LPPGLKVFYLTPGAGFDDRHAEVCDASDEGLGLIVSCPAGDLEEDSTVIVKDATGEIRLLARIVHVEPQSDDLCRIGLQFRKARSLERYKNLLRNVL
jgi:hypothetical protein